MKLRETITNNVAHVDKRDQSGINYLLPQVSRFLGLKPDHYYLITNEPSKEEGYPAKCIPISTYSIQDCFKEMLDNASVFKFWRFVIENALESGRISAYLKEKIAIDTITGLERQERPRNEITKTAHRAHLFALRQCSPSHRSSPPRRR